MAWRVARSLDRLLAQLNAAYPARSKASDGSIGDAAHASRDSDHNPWILIAGMGIVSARDFTHDPAHGVDCEALYQALVASRDPRIKYVIWNRTITSGAGEYQPWVRRPYSGSNAHTKHLHLSVKSSSGLFDDTRDWAIGATGVVIPAPGTTPAPPSSAYETYKAGVKAGSRTVKRGSAGDDVKVIQRWEAIAPDGYFGPGTEADVKATQKRNGLDPDGIVGPKTWAIYGVGAAAPAPRPAPAPAPAPRPAPAPVGPRNLKKGDKGEDVKVLQRKLASGYPAYRHALGAMVVDGDFGATTDKWVREFQRKSGLGADGIVGPATRKKLGI